MTFHTPEKCMQHDRKGQCTPQIVSMDHLNLLLHSLQIRFVRFHEIAMSLRSKSVGDNTYQHRPTSFALTNAFQLLYYIFLTDCEECTVEAEAEAERWSSKYYTTATKHELMQTHKNPMHFMEAS